MRVELHRKNFRWKCMLGIEPQLPYAWSSFGMIANGDIVLQLLVDLGHLRQLEVNCCSLAISPTLKRAKTGAWRRVGASTKGWEMIWGQFDHGCHVHTVDVSYGPGSDNGA